MLAWIVVQLWALELLDCRPGALEAAGLVAKELAEKLTVVNNSCGPY